MFILAQMNADGGEAVRFVMARIRNGIVAISDPIASWKVQASGGLPACARVWPRNFDPSPCTA
jgi:hypothetical protein